MAVIEFTTDLESVLEHLKMAQEEEQNVEFFINNINVRSLDLQTIQLYDTSEDITLTMQGDTDYLISYLEDFQQQEEGAVDLDNLTDVRVKGIRVGYDAGSDEVMWFEPPVDEEAMSMLDREDFLDLEDVVEDMRQNNISTMLIFEDPSDMDEDDDTSEEDGGGPDTDEDDRAEEELRQS